MPRWLFRLLALQNMRRDPCRSAGFWNRAESRLGGGSRCCRTRTCRRAPTRLAHRCSPAVRVVGIPGTATPVDHARSFWNFDERPTTISRSNEPRSWVRIGSSIHDGLYHTVKLSPVILANLAKDIHIDRCFVRAKHDGGSDMTISNTSMRAKIVHINVERGTSGAYFATSPELKGLMVSKMTIEAVHNDIPRAITELYAACGVDVVVTPVEDDSEFEHPWVAVPAVVAKAALMTA